MKYKMITVSGAPRPWRVLLGLTFKGLDYDIRYLEASKGELKSPEFLGINPRGTVPVLQVDDIVLTDSIGILAWLDREHPENPLFGATAEQSADIWQKTMESCDYLRDATDRLLKPVFGRDLATPTSELKNAAQDMTHEINRLENFLEGNGPFLAGEIPSALDAVCYPEIRLTQRAVETKPAIMGQLGFENMSERFPLTAAWKDRIEALPNHEKTMPPHWQD